MADFGVRFRAATDTHFRFRPTRTFRAATGIQALQRPAEPFVNRRASLSLADRQRDAFRPLSTPLPRSAGYPDPLLAVAPTHSAPDAPSQAWQCRLMVPLAALVQFEAPRWRCLS